MERSIFEFNDYKSFLTELVGPKDRRTGMKGGIARALQCQATYVSQVLHGKAHFSLEQTERLSEYLGYSGDEKHFLLLLLQQDRAGTESLRKYFQEQLQQLRERRLSLTRRLGEHSRLTAEQQSIYYTSWQYAAVHIALTIPDLRKPEVLGRYLGIRQKRLMEVLNFLVEIGLAERRGGLFLPGKTEVRIGRDSQSILKHHAHWRTQAIESLEREEMTDLHYSGVISLSGEDIVRLKSRILEFIQKMLTEIRKSKEECLYSFDIDFFSMKKG